MSLLDIVAENISDYDIPWLPAIAVIKLTPDICVLVHKASRRNNLEIAVSFLHDDTKTYAHDVFEQFPLLSEVGESWIMPCEMFVQEIPVTTGMDPWAIEFVDEPLKFWYKVDDLGYEYAIVR
jgi:hypothetical protein